MNGHDPRESGPATIAPVSPGQAEPPATPPARTDERVAHAGRVRQLAARPELGALIGALAVFVFFASLSPIFRSVSGAANWLEPASTLGVVAVAVALLLIGGEFDLSAGVMIGTTGLVTATLVTHMGWNIWPAAFASLLLALAIGAINGLLVVTTKLPSFIITLGTFLALQGVNVGVTKAVTDSVQISGVSASPGFGFLHDLLASSLTLGTGSFRVTIVWWVAVTLAATYLLQRTVFGNWIFAVGGAPDAARKVGVPVARTKVILFMMTSASAWFAGTMLLVRLDSVQATAGVGQELIVVTAAVIGGCLLTGGYGSAVGAALGSLIFGMTQIGIVYAGWDADWFKTFLGVMLLLAVMANELVKRTASQGRAA
jgi:simple sugar transport system permease protein